MNESERELSTAQIATAERPGETGWSPLFSEEDTRGFRERWDAIQTAFVDEPRDAVQRADGLVAEAMKRLAGGFADARAELERQWAEGRDISTEDLRQAFKRYRTFFDRLLAI